MSSVIVKRIATAGAMSLALLIAGSASAQQGSGLDPRWTAWLGCWEPETAIEGATTTTPIVCVIPAESGPGVVVATVENGAVVSREPMTATGEAQRADRESCSGTTTASWSADGRRIYRSSTVACPGGFQRNSTGLMAMTPTGEWIDVEGLAAPLDEAVRVLRYRPQMITGQLPAEVARALDGHTVAARTARLGVSSQATLAEVEEASKRVGPSVVEAWLVERGHGFAMELDAARLVALRDAGVPTRAIDMVVALSYPERFAINRELRQAGARPDERQNDGRAIAGSSAWDPWGYPTYGWGYYSRNGMYNRYGYDQYGYGYDPYGRYYGGSRVIVVTPNTGEEPAARPRGRMVNGSGYSRPADPGPSSSSGSSGSGSSSSGGSSSAGSSGSSGGSSGGGEVRTAKPKD